MRDKNSEKVCLRVLVKKILLAGGSSYYLFPSVSRQGFQYMP